MKDSPLRSALVAALVLFVLFQGCDSDGRKQQDPVQPSRPSLNDLKNMAYDGFDGLEGPIVLEDGAWEGQPYEPGSASRPRIVFAGVFMLWGDLDGKPGDEALAFLELSTGGSGQLTYLCVVGRDRDTSVNLATALIGDRVQIRDARIIDRNILVDIVEAAPADPACCPGQLSSYGWRFVREGVLERRALTDTPGRMSLKTLEGQEWVLRSWDVKEPAPSKPAVTLTYVGGKFVGMGGCNRYFASVSERVSAGDITVGPVGSTQMACPEGQMKIEGRFFGNLGRVTKFGFLLGQLALTSQSESGIQTMLFEKR